MSEANEKLVNDFCAAWSRKNVDELMGYFTDDAVYHNIPTDPAAGKGAVRQVINSYLPMAQSIEFKVLRSASAGNFVFNERIDIFSIGGKRVELPVTGVFEVEGGKIKLWRDYFDMATWTKQMS